MPRRHYQSWRWQRVSPYYLLIPNIIHMLHAGDQGLMSRAVPSVIHDGYHVKLSYHPVLAISDKCLHYCCWLVSESMPQICRHLHWCITDWENHWKILIIVMPEKVRKTWQQTIIRGERRWWFRAEITVYDDQDSARPGVHSLPGHSGACVHQPVSCQ